MIVVAPLLGLDPAIATYRPSHIVSLSSPGAQAAQLPPGSDVLRLTFHDISEPRPGLEMATLDDVRNLIAFARSWPRERPMLIHCWAGVSRSPAAAFVVACAIGTPGSERDIALRMRRAASFVTPNRHLVALGDDLLERQGSMRAAMNEIGRGTEFVTSLTFVVDDRNFAPDATSCDGAPVDACILGANEPLRSIDDTRRYPL